MAEPNNENGEGAPESGQAAGGLKHEPFTAEITSAAFYPGATREQRLNLLLSLVPLGEALLITGVSGVGRRTLLAQFISRAQESWRLCRIDAAVSVLDSNTLLQQLAGCFAPDAASLSDRQESERMLLSQLQGLRKSAQQPILLIENSERISESGFRALSKFIADESEEEKLLGVVLFGSSEIEEKLNNPALQTLRGQIKHTFELPLLSEEETAAYLDHRVRAAGLQGDSPFTEAVSRAIYGASNGLPRKINELAQAVLQNKRQAEPQQPEPTTEAADDASESKLKKYFTPKNLWPFAVAALLGTVLLFQERINSLFEVPPEESQTAVQKPLSVVQEKTAPPATDEIVQQEEPASVEGDADSIEESVVVTEEAPVAEVEHQPETVAERKESELEEEAGLPVAELARDLTEPELDTSQREIEQGDETVEEPVEVTVTESSSIVDGKEQGRWILDQSPEEYTLQLVAQEVPEKREKFLKRFGLEDMVERFSTSKKGRRWHVAAYGVYPSRTAALEGSRQLPEGVVPWVRSFGSIQQELWQGDGESPVSSPAVSLVPPPAVKPKLTEQEQWVMARSPNHFVLQLVAFEQEAKTRGFVTSHRLEGEARIVRLINRGMVWHVAVYGVASNRTEAKFLSENLNKNNGVKSTWTRTYGSLQEAMREFQQK